MKRVKTLCLSLSFCTSLVVCPLFKVNAATVQSSITRSASDQRALNMINLSWTYSSEKNGKVPTIYSSSVTQPKQFTNISTTQVTGIPYNWGGMDSLDSNSYDSTWTNFIDAVNNGAYAGNINSSAGLGHIPGTAGIDCSGFVQSTFNIKDSKLSTTTLFDKYFTKISISEIKHMDILDKPGDHVVIFDKWGTLNGVYGAYTYEATTSTYWGGIQGTKRYFLSMNSINNGYIAGRYINISEDSSSIIASNSTTTSNNSTSLSLTATTATPDSLSKSTSTTLSSSISLNSTTSTANNVCVGTFGQITNSITLANFRANPSTSANIIGTIPKDTIAYLIAYSNSWYQIKYNEQVGWVYAPLIIPVKSGQYVAVISTINELNIRNIPTTTSSNIVGVIKQGEYAEVLDYSSDGNWIKIRINGIEGYAYKKYLNYIS